HRFVRPRAGRHCSRVGDVEAGAAGPSISRDAAPFAFLGDGPCGFDAPVLAMPPVTQLSELALEFVPAASIVFVLDLPFEPLFAVALLDERDVDRGTRIVREGAEAAATQLEFDEILLQLDPRDGRALAAM